MRSIRRAVRLTFGVGAVATAMCALAAGSSMAAVTGTNVASSVANAIGANTGSAFTFSVGATQAGTGDASPSLSGFPTAGSTYGILTSGDAELADTLNDGNGEGANLSIEDPSRGDANDSQTLQVNFNVPGGSNCLNLDYKFFSEEFPEFVNQGYNDGFIAELNASSWTTSDQKINAPLDFAAGYGDQVAVDTVGPTVVDPANSAGTTYDAATKLITTKTVVAPGPNTIYLSVFDAGDHIFDSAVFVDNLRFTTEDPSTCRPPDVFEGKVGAKLDGKLSAKGKSLTIPINCVLPEGASDPCVGDVVVTATGAGGASASKRLNVAKGGYSVAPGTIGKAKAKLTKAGKRLAKARGKAKVQVRITNSINGTSQSFRAKL